MRERRMPTDREQVDSRIVSRRPIIIQIIRQAFNGSRKKAIMYLPITQIKMLKN
jgi:hypothetical protein